MTTNASKEQSREEGSKAQDQDLSPKQDTDAWQDLARGKIFARMHDGQIIYGREERDRSSWAALAKRSGAEKKAADAKGERTAQDLRAVAQPIGLAEPVLAAGLSPLDQLDRCMADLSDNHRRLAQYTEKSVRYLWQETKALLGQKNEQLTEKERTIDQLAMQNRSLKAEVRELSPHDAGDGHEDDRQRKGREGREAQAS